MQLEKCRKRLREEDEGRKPSPIPLPKDEIPYHEQDLPLRIASSEDDPEKHILLDALTDN